MSEEQKATRFLTFDDLAARLPFSKSTLRRRIRDGSIPSYQPGGHGSRLAFHPDVLRVAAAPADPADRSSNQTEQNGERHVPAPPKLPGPKPKWLSRISISNSNRKAEEG